MLYKRAHNHDPMEKPIKGISINEIYPELIFSASRSGGPGGQNVNKVNSKVTLRWDVQHSNLINEQQKNRVQLKLDKFINKVGEVVLSAETSRSQLMNKEEALKKLNALLINAFHTRKPRKNTKPTKASVARRLASKKRHSQKKTMRKNLDD